MLSIFNMIAYTYSQLLYDIYRLYSSLVRIPPHFATIADNGSTASPVVRFAVV